MKLPPPRTIPISISYSSTKPLRLYPLRSGQVRVTTHMSSSSHSLIRRQASTTRPKHPSTRLSSTMNPPASEASPLLSSSASLDQPSPDSVPSIQLASTGTLLRSYLVYTLCSLPLLIDHSPRLLHALTHTPIPGLKALTEWGVRHTFFAQFVPGETVDECVHTMRELRERGVGAVLNYSAEVEEETAGLSSVLHVAGDQQIGGAGGTDGHLGPLSRRSSSEGVVLDKAKLLEKQRLDEVIKALRVSGEYELDIESKGQARGSTGFALKITGLIDPMVLQRASTTLLRLRNAEGEKSGVPYPGTPVSGDGRVVASSPDSADKSIFELKGTVPHMGVLHSDEGVRPSDLEEMHALWKNLCLLCEEAKTHGIKLMVDAEHTWYQPALDAYTLLLSEKYNRPPKDGNWTGPLIYGTYQSYLVRQKAHLPVALQHAKDNGYALGIKLVRGAYFVQERKKWKEEGREGADPIWIDKDATDTSYNTSIKTIVSSLTSQLSSDRPHALSVVFGTHNPESVDLIIDGLKSNGLAKEVSGGKLRLRDDVKGRVGIAQLYGMKDDLMDKVVATFEPSNQPVSLKYIAYGKLDEVIPFLGRRAIENKSLMSGEGGAAAERKRIWAELSRRYFGHETAAA